MKNLENIIKFLDQKMQPELFDDFVPNGLQIEGTTKIKKIAFATSATTNVIQQSVFHQVDALFVHHGLFWKNEKPNIIGAKKKKIQLLLNNNISLIAYHLPLDALHSYGNNYPILLKLGCKQNSIKKFQDIGYIGTLQIPILTNSFLKEINSIYNTKAIHINPAKVNKINNICVVSGNGTSYFPKVVEYNAKVKDKQKIHAFISGEGTEWVYGMAYDYQIVYSAVGHNISEEIGPKNIQMLLEKKFKIETIFIKEKNPF